MVLIFNGLGQVVGVQVSMCEFDKDIKNPLIPLVKIAVCESCVALSEYQLMKHLDTFGVFSQLQGDASTLLFQKHFLLMNALYQLRDECIKNNSGLVYISALNIQFFPEIDIVANQDKLTSQFISHTADDKGANIKLRSYYLDMKNLATTANEIDGMLIDFWKKFAVWQGTTSSELLEQCLKELQVDRSTSFEDIQKSYRLLVAKHHPDRGGDADEFVKIRRAYEVISAAYN